MMPTDLIEAERIDRFLASQRRTGILLTRPYPTVGAPKVRSRLGGLPTLPTRVAWPRGRSYERDVPMHFLAQIDCAELPHVDPRLPAAGMLFFFAVFDEEQIWSAKNPRESISVIYESDVPRHLPPTPAPDDLLPLLDAEASDNPFEPAWLLPGEAGPSVHHSWPLIALPCDTWPDVGHDPNLPFQDHDLYQAKIEALRVGSVVAAAGLPTRSDPPAWETEIDQPLLLPGSNQFERLEFPQIGLMIDRIARLIARYFRVALDELPGGAIHAKRWIHRASAIGLHQAPSEREKEEFRSWLLQLTTDPLLPPHFRMAWPRLLTDGLAAAVACVGGSDAADAIPRHFYDALENLHLPFDQERRWSQAHLGWWRIRARNHQMLGHVPMIQSIPPGADDDTVCLLRLATDYGIEMRFGDAGNATFWIEGADLEQRRFDRCYASVEGG